jgi:hypothetical protein
LKSVGKERMTDIEGLAALLRRLPPAPPAWVQAAQELPRARASLDELVARAERDAAFRRALLENLEAALAETGLPSDERLMDELRRRLVE